MDAVLGAMRRSRGHQFAHSGLTSLIVSSIRPSLPRLNARAPFSGTRRAIHRLLGSPNCAGLSGLRTQVNARCVRQIQTISGSLLPALLMPPTVYLLSACWRGLLPVLFTRLPALVPCAGGPPSGRSDHCLCSSCPVLSNRYCPTGTIQPVLSNRYCSTQRVLVVWTFPPDLVACI